MGDIKDLILEMKECMESADIGTILEREILTHRHTLMLEEEVAIHDKICTLTDKELELREESRQLRIEIEELEEEIRKLEREIENAKSSEKK